MTFSSTGLAILVAGTQAAAAPTATVTQSSTPSTQVSSPATPTPSISSPGTSVTHLSNSWGAFLIGVIVAFVLLVGLIVWSSRRSLEGGADAGDQSQAQLAPTIVRSWLALAIVGGLLILCAASFLLDDSTLRSTLIGGLVAAASGTIAFYFSSKSADQARQDLLNATGTRVAVPDLFGMTEAEVNAALAGVPLQAQLTPFPVPAGDHVATQSLPAHSQAISGSMIKVTFA